MEKLKYIPLGLFSLMAIKNMIFTSSLADALILLVLGSLVAFYEFKSQEKQMKAMNEKIEKLEKTINEKIEKLEKTIEETKTHVSGLKLGQQMRAVNVR